MVSLEDFADNDYQELHSYLKGVKLPYLSKSVSE